MNVPALTAVPAGLVTLIAPVLAPDGTVARIVVFESTVKTASLPANATCVVLVKLVPVRVTTVPRGPLVGVNDVIVGGSMTTKSAVLVAVPAGLLTLTFPVVAPAGTVAVICVLEFAVNAVAGVPVKVTVVVPANPLPAIVTLVPTGPLAGVNEVMLGATMTVKSAALAPVPAGLVTLIFPVVAPAGTVAVT